MSATQIAEQSPVMGWTENSAEFDYRPMPVLIPVCCAFAFFSLTAFMIDWLLAVPVFGIVLAVGALWQIHRSAGGYGGHRAAWALLGILLAELLGAGAFHAYSFVTELPEGFQRVNFSNDISKYELKTVNGETQVPAPVQELNDQPVFLKGYMYPTREMQGLSRFVLCKDMGQCCFGGNPKPTDMIVVEMSGNQTVDHRTGLVSVAGVFRTHTDVKPGDLNPVYQLDCTYFNVAKTSY